YKDKLGSPGAIVDAKAQYDLADTTWRAAVARRDALDKTIKGVEGGTLDTLPIDAEADGMVKNVHVQPGQKVASGALLFDVVSLDRVWVRVPVYVGDASAIAADRHAAIGGLSDAPDAPTRDGRPVTAPPTGDPLAVTVDLYFEVDNADLSLRPG